MTATCIMFFEYAWYINSTQRLVLKEYVVFITYELSKHNIFNRGWVISLIMSVINLVYSDITVLSSSYDFLDYNVWSLQEECKCLGGFLAEVETIEENKFIKNIAKNRFAVTGGGESVFFRYVYRFKLHIDNIEVL